MDYIKFSDNYNGKLDQEEFTTIRIYDFDRYKIGHVYNIMLGDQILFKAAITKMRPIVDLRKLPDHIIKSDSGLENAEEFLKLMESFYGNLDDKKWLMITLSKIYEQA
jgi:hypothetical protein